MYLKNAEVLFGVFGVTFTLLPPGPSGFITHEYRPVGKLTPEKLNTLFPIVETFKTLESIATNPESW